MERGELCRICEKADADTWEDALKAAPTSFRSKVTVKHKRSGSAVLGAISDLDVVAMNRAVGIGYPDVPTDEQLDEIMEFYREADSRRYAIQLCPSAATTSLIERLQERGFSHFNNWTKLIRSNGEPIPDTDSRLSVKPVDIVNARAFADIVCPAFSWPGVAKEFVTALIGRDGWHHFMAYDGETPVATGAMFVRDGIGWFGFAATHPDHRRKGAQSVLLAERLRRAKDAGVEHIVVETAQEMPGKPNSSYHNLLRHGFAVAYQRPNYLRFKEEEPIDEA